MFDNSTSIYEMIQKNYDEIMNIYKGITSIKMSYDLDVLKEGTGIILDKSVPNEITLKNKLQSYNLTESPILNVINDFTINNSRLEKTVKLKSYSNYIKLSNGFANEFDKDIALFIDDTETIWENGQTYKIVVDSNFPMDMYTLGSYDFVVYTDTIDRNGNGNVYGVEVARIYSSDFYKSNGTPSIEIICLDSKNYVFTFDLKN